MYCGCYGNFNSDLRNSLGNRGTVNPNQRGVKLLDFANYFNLCPTNLLSICEGPLETYFSHCERYKPTIDYNFLPNCLPTALFRAELLTETLKKHQIMSLSSCR